MLFLSVFSISLLAVDPDLPDGSAKATKQLAGLKHPPELTLKLFAAEPQLASPVAISVDERGRVFVAEEYRFCRGTEENRTRPFFLNDDLQLKTVDDRMKMYQKWAKEFPGGMEWFSQHSDQVRLVEDRNGDGKADHSEVFAGGFNDPLDGLAAGVLAQNGKVWLTNIPNLWQLENGKRTKLLTGFGVSCAFLGHDLHGLIFGPDGKLYFSIGDRGYNVTSKEGKNFTGLRTGAIFRCDPDGTNLEVIMTGLRNPQELAFDQLGNLFTADNNCDKGDDARLVHVLEGGDAGWNMAYQTMPAPYLAGPWFAERMWHTPHEGQPAWILPPIGKVGSGPGGFLFTSGSSLPARYKNSFILANYVSAGGLEAFRLRPNGASYVIDDYHDMLKPFQPTDVDLGPDGKLYVSDFGPLDWSGKSTGGRLFTLTDESKQQDPDVIEMKRVFAEGFEKQSDEKLMALLRHPEMKLRLRAQFELVRRGKAEVLEQMLKSSDQLARLHAIWGLGQLARTKPAVVDAVKPLLKDGDEEIQGQAARALGNAGRTDAISDILWLARGYNRRTALLAIEALGKLKARDASSMLLNLMRTTDDVFLRHTIVVALDRIGDRDMVLAAAQVGLPFQKTIALLVLRRWKDPELARLLKDPLTRTEAARAIHDLPMTELLPTLAALKPETDSEPLVRRIIDTNLALGKAENAKAVLAIALDITMLPAMRYEALAALKEWSEPSPRDRVTGFWRELPKRDSAIIRDMLNPAVDVLLTNTIGTLQAEVVSLIGTLNLNVKESQFTEWVTDPKRDPLARAAALKILGQRKAAGLEELIARVSAPGDPDVRLAACEVLLNLDAAKGVALYKQVLNDGSTMEKQRCLKALAKLNGSDDVLDAWATRLGKNEVPEELLLDVLDALKTAPSTMRKLMVAKFELGIPRQGIGKYRTSLAGGDATKGRDIFINHSAAQCIRCHKVGGNGGNAGPDLSDVVKRNPEKTREHILESLVDPSAKLATGFANVSIEMLDGRRIAGTIVDETATDVKLKTPDGRLQRLAVADIESRTKPMSAMPAMDRTLNARELRDLVEYLATLK